MRPLARLFGLLWQVTQLPAKSCGADLPSSMFWASAGDPNRIGPSRKPDAASRPSALPATIWRANNPRPNAGRFKKFDIDGMSPLSLTLERNAVNATPMVEHRPKGGKVFSK